MTDFVRDSTALDAALYAAKTDVKPVTNTTRQITAADLNAIRTALEDIRTYLQAGVLDASATVTVASLAATATATIKDLDLVNSADPAVGPEMDFAGNRGRWFTGIDVANSPTSRDFVLAGQRGTYTFSDGATTSGSPTLTSASGGGFTTDIIGATISGSGIPNGTTVSAVGGVTSLTLSANATATATGVTVTITRNTAADIIYLKHRGALSPTIGIGVTPPDGLARLEVSANDAEVAMGTMRLRRGPSQTGKVLTLHDSTPTDQWWVDKDFYMSSSGGILMQAEASASGHIALLADNAKAQFYSIDQPTGSGGVLRIRNQTNNVSVCDLGTDGSFRHLSTKIGFFGAAVATKPTVTGSRGGNAALASLLTALAGLGLITDSTTA